MFIKLIMLAFSLEGMALLMMANNGPGFWSMLAIYLVHAAASVVVAIVVWGLYPAPMRSPKIPVLCLLFVANFFVPLLPVMMRLGQEIGSRYRQLHEEAPVSVVSEPEYSIYRATSSMKSRGGRTRTKLTNLKVPVADRLTALLAIQEAPARVSADLLRQLLADPIEDIRLLAYGMIDGKEKSIGVRILAEESKLERENSDDSIYGCNKRLAELYWELVYQKLVQGDMMRHACEQARKHANQAIEIQPDDAGIWFLLTRIAVELREAEPAREGLVHAERLGFPADQLVPYKAELAFIESRFDEIPGFFYRLRNVPSAIRLAAVYKFWTQS